MRGMKNLIAGISAAALSALTPFAASAHEVYVLNSNQISQAVDSSSFNLLDVISRNLGRFEFWALIGIILVFCIFFISTSRYLERKLDPFLEKIRKYGPFIARFTIGISFIACAYYGATFGPELPLSSTFGVFSGLLVWVFLILGALSILGLYARPAAFAALVIFICTIASHGAYMLTYANYLGEIIVLLILGAHSLSLDSYIAKRRELSGKTRPAPYRGRLSQLREYLAPRSFSILRVLFGVALIFASAYAKIIHNNLALFTVEQYHLDKLLGFEAHFLVLGAAIVEILIGLFFILGFEIRFTAFFLLFWLTVSLIFFGEIVWPHLILIGIPIAYIFYGYDKYSLEMRLAGKKGYQPVL